MDNPGSDRKKKKKNKEKKQKNISQALNKWKKRIIYLVITGAALYGFVLLVYSTPMLPPTSPLNHSEGVPEGYILTEPMLDSVQRHMLEHANGRGRPGIIIQYNCRDYQCEDDLVSKLENIVREYIGYVYLAPGRYDGKIILTKTGQMEILDRYDEDRIRAFIEN